MISIDTNDEGKIKKITALAKELGVTCTIGSYGALGIVEDVYAELDNLGEGSEVYTEDVAQKISTLSKEQYNDFITYMAEAIMETGYGERIGTEIQENVGDALYDNLAEYLDDFIEKLKQEA